MNFFANSGSKRGLGPSRRRQQSHIPSQHPRSPPVRITSHWHAVGGDAADLPQVWGRDDWPMKALCDDRLGLRCARTIGSENLDVAATSQSLGRYPRINLTT